MYRLVVLCAAVIAVWDSVPRVAAADRKDGLKQFDVMKTQAQKKLDSSPASKKDPNVEITKTEKVPVLSSKFNLDPGGTTPPPAALGMKIWAELRDGPNAGKFVNPAAYRWAAKERFWLWFETAAPVQLAIFQTYPDSVDGARQVVPDEKYPTSFKTIYPGEKFKFPLPFIMDDNGKTEYMAIVVARTDCDHLPLNGAIPLPPAPPQPGTPPPPPGPTITINNEVDVAIALNGGSVYKSKLGAAQKDAFTAIYKTASKSGKIDGKSTKFNICEGGTDVPTPGTGTGTNVLPPDDAALLLFGAGKIGMQQLELNKRPK